MTSAKQKAFKNLDAGSESGDSKGAVSDEEIKKEQKALAELRKAKSKRENGKVKIPDLRDMKKSKSAKAGSSLAAQFSETSGAKLSK